MHLEPRIYFVFASQMRKEMDSDLLKFVFSNSTKETNTFYFKRGGKIFFEAKRVQSEMFEVWSESCCAPQLLAFEERESHNKEQR